jgi:hypothetical protein
MGELEPELHARDLPDDVVRLRMAADAEAAAREQVLQARIDAHLAVYTDVIDVLVANHERLADASDLEIGADTRWSAMWELAGRALSTARVWLHDLRGGFTTETDGTARALHEAVQLLSALQFDVDGAAVRRWLAGEWVRPGEARALQQAAQEHARQEMQAAGLAPALGDLQQLGRTIYSLMSESAHHQRAGLAASIAPRLRRYVYGPHPDPTHRAAHVDVASEVFEEVVLVVGSAIGQMVGGDYWNRLIRPLQERLEQVRRLHPLA